MTARKGYYASDPLAGISVLRGNKRHREADPDWAPSPLNILTTMRYERCGATGGHEPSGTTVWRIAPAVADDVEMEVCARCAVPYMPRAVLGLNNRPVQI